MAPKSPNYCNHRDTKKTDFYTLTVSYLLICVFVPLWLNKPIRLFFKNPIIDHVKAYKEPWIRNRAVVQQAEQWHRQGLLTDAQIEATRQEFPFNFRQTNGFLEVGLFLFTCVAVMASYMLPASIILAVLDVIDNERIVYGLFSLVAAAVTWWLGQFIINHQQLYRNGVDNAFVAMLTGFLVFGFGQFMPQNLTLSSYCLLTLPLLLAVVWYYGDTLIAFIALTTFYAFVFDGMLKVSWGQSALPFVMMALSGGLYALARRLDSSPYYTDPMNLVQWVTLIVLAASGNYYVVRELNGLLLEPTPGQPASANAPEIALPWLFWFLKFAIPLFHLYRGFTKKDRMWLILGALGLMAAVSTVHEYVALLPLNVALTLGGAALIGVAVFGIRYLATPRHGLTDDPDAESPDQFFVNLGTAVAMQAAAGAQQHPKNDLHFGGGNFGGGGSEGSY